MKHLVFSILMLTAGIVAAQPSINIGVGGGVALSKGDVEAKLAGESFENDNEKNPFILSAVAYVPVEFVISPLFSVQPELMFSQHRIREEYEVIEPSYSEKTTETYTLNNFEIPVLAKLSLGSGETFKFNIFAGPSVGFNMSGKRDYKSEGSFFGEPFKEEFEGDIRFLGEDVDFDKEFNDDSNDFPGKRLNVNIHAGIGATLAVGGVNLFLNGRLIQGISDLFPDGFSTDFNGEKLDVEIKGNTTRIAITAGVMFPIGGSK